MYVCNERTKVMRVEVDYNRITKIKTHVAPDGDEWDELTWHYSEKLVLDRAAETMEFSRIIGSGCKITNTYYIEEGVSDFLDNIDPDAFSAAAGDPPDAIDDPTDQKQYTITVFTRHGAPRVITGDFDQNGLPAGWPEFIDDVYGFMAFYGLGEIFNEKIYGKAKRRQSDLIFCDVAFEDGGRTYCYLADSDDYEEDDLAVVPAGPDNHEAVARIVSVSYRQPGNAPFPVEKTKHILRKYEEDADSDSLSAQSRPVSS